MGLCPLSYDNMTTRAFRTDLRLPLRVIGHSAGTNKRESLVRCQSPMTLPPAQRRLRSVWQKLGFGERSFPVQCR
jgi:hypothetical protein